MAIENYKSDYNFRFGGAPNVPNIVPQNMFPKSGKELPTIPRWA